MLVTISETTCFFWVGLVICSLLLVDVLSTQTVLSQSQILEIASDDLIAPLGNNLIHYDFTVPEDAVNPKLIGHYNVASGQDLEVAIIEQPCSEDSCISVYYAPHSAGDDVDISLTPGKSYTLGFLNPESGAGERTTQVDFHVQYD